MYRCDDEVVTPVSEEDVSNLEGYVHIMPFATTLTTLFFLELTFLLFLHLTTAGISSSTFDGMRDDSI